MGWGTGERPPSLPSSLLPSGPDSPARPAHLIEHKLGAQVDVSACGAQVALDQCLHALLLQCIRHVVEGVLIRERCQSLEGGDRTARLKLMESRSQEPEGPRMAPGSPYPTLLMRVTVYTSNSGSAPFFSSRMDTKLAHGRAPVTQIGSSHMGTSRREGPEQWRREGQFLTRGAGHRVDCTDEQWCVALRVLHKDQQQLQGCLHHQAGLGGRGHHT